MEGRSLRPHQIRHHHVQNGGGSSPQDCPFQIRGCSAGGFAADAQKIQQRLLKYRTKEGKQDSTENSAVKTKGGTSVYRLVIPASHGPAHHAGASHAKQVIHRVECQKHRRRQSHRRVLNGIVEHAYKIGVRQIIKYHHQRAENGGNRQRHHRSGNRGIFKKLCLLCIFHLFPSPHPLPQYLQPDFFLLYLPGQSSSTDPDPILSISLFP